ncbi:MAG: EamA family transporter, partial [Thermoplasmata archaeon]|nr:EamA family transporter [Thermoplasmata archaeon]
MSKNDWFLLGVLALLWGTAFPVIRIGLLAGASPLSFGAARFTIAAALMAVIAVTTRQRLPDARTLVLTAVFGGVLVIGAYAAFLYIGEETVSGGLSAVLISTVPLWTSM